ncbi:hypothetical protein SAY86_023573 [Trapa natans]|uniref:Uncharacterized protein n=1 Tax=Trapa natans TaxID=22666 RepID=A0AAN7LQ64_TRANT|nr:hypothetical protein SAY86_023573 [Trapa natans]
MESVDHLLVMALGKGFRSASKVISSSSESLQSKSEESIRLGHGHHGPYYLHAKHMYNLDRMKYQKLKMSLGVLTAFTIGVAVPV